MAFRKGLPESKQVGLRIRWLRHAQGWTLQETGERIDIDYKYLQKLESGYANPTVETLAKIARGFAIGLPDLFRSDEPPEGRRGIEILGGKQ